MGRDLRIAGDPVRAGPGRRLGPDVGGQFYAGYLTEYSLSLDNLFIFYVIMSWLSVPAGRQQRVLLFGIGLALVLRTVLIVAGTVAVNRFGRLFHRWAPSCCGPPSA